MKSFFTRTLMHFILGMQVSSLSLFLEELYAKTSLALYGLYQPGIIWASLADIHLHITI